MYLVTLLLVVIQWIRGCEDGREDSQEVTPIEEAPFAVIVLFTNSKYFCSGTLVDVNWVLTSAHCLYNLFGVFTEDDGTITIIAGASGLKDADDEVATGKAQVRHSKRIVVHTYYSWLKNFINDLALIKVKQPFTLTERVGVAPMLLKDIRKEDVLGPHKCVGYGFGAVGTKNPGHADFYLKKHKYEVTKNCRCLWNIGSVRLPFSILQPRNPFMCDSEGKCPGACYGDNGGPLVCKGHVRGIITTLFNYDDRGSCDGPWVGDVRCGDPETLVVFTDLCLFSMWLNKVVPSIPVADENCILDHEALAPVLVKYSDFRKLDNWAEENILKTTTAEF